MLFWYQLPSFPFHHTWNSLALVTAILLQIDVPLYVTWPIVSQICPLIYKWNEFNFLSITCFYLYVCLWRGHAHATAHMWWSKKNLKSVLSVYHVNSGDEVKLSVSVAGFYVPNHLRGPRIPIFLWDNSIQSYVPRLISYLCHFK